jgi:O-antigen/teichoic acid export membrane protein
MTIKNSQPSHTLMPHLFRHKLLSASAINGGGFILSSITVLLWSYLLVRSYPAAASGQLLLSLSVAGLINLLDLGVSIGLIRVISALDPVVYPHSPWNYFRSAIWLITLTELVVGFVAVGWWKASSFHDLPFSGYLSIIVFAVSTQAVLLCTGLFKGLVDFKAANLISTGTALSVYGIGVAMILAGLDVWTVLLAMTCAQLFCACAAVIFAMKQHRPKNTAVTPSFSQLARVIYPNLLRSSIEMFPQMFTGIFFLHAQRFIIARYAGLDSVAIFSLAYSIATRIHAMMNAFLEVIFPMARQLHAQGINMARFCIKVGSIFAAIYFILAFAATAIAIMFVPGISAPLSIYSIGVMFAVAAVPAFHFLNGSGASVQVSVCSLLSPAFFLALAGVMNYSSFAISTNLLLPVAYAVTMALMLVAVGFLLRHHLRRLIIA